MDMTSLRKEYTSGELLEQHLADDPLIQFKDWFDAAMREEAFEPNACALATAGADLQPAVRIVLLKSIEDRGLVFFTNYESRKGRELDANPQAALLFFWPKLERQVRVEGKVEKTSATESDAYFRLRPRNAQLAASISKQSEVLPSRSELEAAYTKQAQSIGEGAVQRPERWGGYRVVPHRYEFWQGRESRLHDRFRYVLENGVWRHERLWP
jgi:pyridoxamine 5'-phosphate oxidase